MRSCKLAADQRSRALIRLVRQNHSFTTRMLQWNSAIRQRFPRIGPQPQGVHDKLGSVQHSFDDFRNSRPIFDAKKTHVLRTE